jgi:hypothetical protein
MPYVGQDIFNNAKKKATERTVETMQGVRSGQWKGKVPPEMTAQYRAQQYNQRNMQRFMQNQQRMGGD